MNEKYRQLQERIAEIADLNHAAALIGWDQQVYMPEGAAEELGEDVLGGHPGRPPVLQPGLPAPRPRGPRGRRVVRTSTSALPPPNPSEPQPHRGDVGFGFLPSGLAGPELNWEKKERDCPL